MKFKELTEAQISVASKVYHDKDIPWDERMKILSDLFGKSERTTRKWCSEKLNFKEKEDDVPSPQYDLAQKKKINKEKKRFLISWAQSDTSVHSNLLKNMEAYAAFLDADIHIVAGRYRNPTSVKNKPEEEWDSCLTTYIDAGRHNVHKYLSIMSDVRIQPTAVNPMSDLHSMSGINSCIFGHPKVQMETIPVLYSDKPKQMLTTGALTKKNYTDSKSGKKGEFHHTYGFVVVEIKDEDTFYMRQVTADDESGNFSDLFYRVEDGHVTEIENISGIVFGDIHYGSEDKALMSKTHELLEKIKPTHVILHDVFDGFSINHHEADDPFIQFGKEAKGLNSLKDEIDYMLNGLNEFEKYENVVVVRSNHDDFLDKWLKTRDWRKESSIKNSMEYMEYAQILLKQHEEDIYEVKGVIPELINQRFPKFITLAKNDSYKVKKWEVGQHGHIGANGSRGSLNNFRKLNIKMITGHSHTPGRKDGALVVGTSTHLRVGYNRGPSSWLQSHVIIHTDGRAQHINFVKDKKGEINFTTFKCYD